MPTINYFVSAKKRDLAAIYMRLSHGKAVDLIVKSGLFVAPDSWSNARQSIKERIRSEKDDELIEKLAGLKKFIETEFSTHASEVSKQWLIDTIFRFHNNRDPKARDLNGYIDSFIKDADAGIRKNAGGLNLSHGTVKAWKVFQRNFGEYQGIYTEKRRKWRTNEKKPIRGLKTLDFKDITIDFYNSFVRYLTDEGFRPSTIGRHIKELKMFMKKAIEEPAPLHNNRQFEYSAFKILNNKSFSVYLTGAEIDKIYNLDLSADPESDIARDAFLVLCETALRVSDYHKVDVNIRTDQDGDKCIFITQSKTGGQVVIPLSARLEKIIDKYKGQLPRIPDQYINKRIKKIAEKCEINEVLRYEVEQYGKRYEKTSKKWELITCHTGRRSAATNMYLAGIPPIDIMKITGHKTERVFLNYIKITPEQNAKKLAKHPYFSGLKAV
jgi:integrase